MTLRWVCGVCRRVNEPEHEVCAGCHVGERGLCYEKLTSGGFVLDFEYLDFAAVEDDGLAVRLPRRPG